MYSTNLGYLPREVRLHVHFLEFRWYPLRTLWLSLACRSTRSLLFQSYAYSVVYMASHNPSEYKFSTPVCVLLFTTLLTAYCM